MLLSSLCSFPASAPNMQWTSASICTRSCSLPYVSISLSSLTITSPPSLPFSGSGVYIINGRIICALNPESPSQSILQLFLNDVHSVQVLACVSVFIHSFLGAVSFGNWRMSLSVNNHQQKGWLDST